ncbi:hypothetical protein BDV95DRAFT_126049 [Massariosphaeria phaeospora]|uniref:Uncharacterized protein n=1 Tax=Massariosphaeria phaeospora TaxID=100035 RepID=A0A7C8MJ18_9PLEO|nr:hypothetical protein BDV95DRAFT_126049 [Massariosphaeria phaeospora]
MLADRPSVPACDFPTSRPRPLHLPYGVAIISLHPLSSRCRPGHSYEWKACGAGNLHKRRLERHPTRTTLALNRKITFERLADRRPRRLSAAMTSLTIRTSEPAPGHPPSLIARCGLRVR